MRLTKDNIDCVRVHACNGVIYEITVGMKSGRVSDMRMYCGGITRDGDGYIVTPLEPTAIPKTVSDFMKDCRPIMLENYAGDEDFTVLKYVKEGR